MTKDPMQDLIDRAIVAKLWFRRRNGAEYSPAEMRSEHLGQESRHIILFDPMQNVRRQQDDIEPDTQAFQTENKRDGTGAG